MELNGALLLARLFAAVAHAFSEYQLSYYAWTDSKVVLSWLSSPPRRWKQFVGNRTSEILDLIPDAVWNHVSSRDNPADIASRGLSPSLLPECHLWFKGPAWLSLSQEYWPKQTDKTVLAEETEPVFKEQKSSSIFTINARTNYVFDYLFDKFSNLTVIINVFAFICRFISNCKRKSCHVKKSPEGEGKLVPSAEERRAAENQIFLYVQSLYFFDDINCLSKNIALKKSSSLRSLNPIIDSDGLLRVGGRLQNSSVSYNAKHPIILPSQHKLSKLLIQQLHKTHLHAGVGLLSNILRQNFWIIQGKKLIKSCVNKCITCRKFSSASHNQLMSALPQERVTLSRPFANCGLDYAGPITLKFNPGRGTKTTKGYIALFVCMATKAYHLEAVSDMTSDAFVAALRRFVARRGVPFCIFSDHGSNFVGAKRKLSELQNISRFNQNNPDILNFISKTSIKWKMIPPASPHFGGLWEAGIKAVKFHLKRVIGQNILTFEELTTVLSQIEAVLNSRPLIKANESDISSLDILTPSHFLHGEVITSLPENEGTRNVNLLARWELVQKIKRDFWKRFQNEYLNTLQTRAKWTKRQANISVDDLVLVKEDNTPPGYWPLGKVIATHPGSDGLVRVVTVKTKSGIFKRPITKISLLPSAQE